jgi:hypothetical protein
MRFLSAINQDKNFFREKKVQLAFDSRRLCERVPSTEIRWGRMAQRYTYKGPIMDLLRPIKDMRVNNGSGLEISQNLASDEASLPTPTCSKLKER